MNSAYTERSPGILTLNKEHISQSIVRPIAFVLDWPPGTIAEHLHNVSSCQIAKNDAPYPNIAEH